MTRAGAEVIDYRWFTPDIVRLRLRLLTGFPFAPGQSVNLTRHGVTRPYSIASGPSQREVLELHIRIGRRGELSRIIKFGTRLGDRFDVSGPHGDCVYAGVDPEATMVLAGAGTGLSCLWGVLQCALHQGHRGPIVLIHGATAPPGHYLGQELRALERSHGGFTFIPSLQAHAAAWTDMTPALDRVTLRAARLFLSGHPAVVAGLRRAAERRGVGAQAIRCVAHALAHRHANAD